MVFMDQLASERGDVGPKRIEYLVDRVSLRSNS